MQSATLPSATARIHRTATCRTPFTSASTVDTPAMSAPLPVCPTTRAEPQRTTCAHPNALSDLPLRSPKSMLRSRWIWPASPVGAYPRTRAGRVQALVRLFVTHEHPTSTHPSAPSPYAPSTTPPLLPTCRRSTNGDSGSAMLDRSEESSPPRIHACPSFRLSAERSALTLEEPAPRVLNGVERFVRPSVSLQSDPTCYERPKCPTHSRS